MTKKNRFQLHDIRRVWDLIQADIAYLKTRYNMDWRPEDVYAQCLAGRAFCYLCEDGFLILKPMENPFTLEQELFVWICCGSGDDVVTDYYPDICELAREIGATVITFESPREGWIKHAKARGWKAAMVTYRVPV